MSPPKAEASGAQGKRITIKDIAKLSGTSIAAVSRVLSDKPHRYSQTTVEKVRKVADEYGYRPNPYARSIRSGRLHSITALVGKSNMNSFFPHRLRQGISEALQEKGYQFNMVFFDEKHIAEPGVLDEMSRSWNTDGLLLNFQGGIPDHVAAFLERSRLPWVLLNSKQAENAVYMNDRENARIATRHLLEQGHERICYLRNEGSFPRHYSSLDRQDSFRTEMKKAGLEAEYLDLPIARCKLAVQVLQERLRAPQRPSAFLSGGLNPLGWALAAAYREQLRIPEDLSLICIESQVSDILGLVVTHVQLNFHQMGLEAVAMLLNKVEQGNPDHSSVMLSSPLMVKDTVVQAPEC